MVKNLPANAGDLGSIPGSRRSPGEGNGNPLWYSCRENSMDRGAWHKRVRCDLVTKQQQKQHGWAKQQRWRGEGMDSEKWGGWGMSW